MAFVAVSTLVLRLRRARGIEHQQIKWSAYTAVVALGSSVLQLTVSEAMDSTYAAHPSQRISIAALVGFPVSVGIAILVYRLYGIRLRLP